MKLTTKSEYALVSLKYLCDHANGNPISVSEVSDAEHLPKDYVEQIFVKLRKGGIIKSVKGIYGGFVLAKEPEQITLKQVIESVEGDIFEVFCSPRLRERIVCQHFSSCSVRPFWRKLKQLIDDFCSSVTLASLAEGEDDLQKQWNLSTFNLLDVENNGRSKTAVKSAKKSLKG